MAPGIDDHRMPVIMQGLALGLVGTGLAGGQHVGLGLDGAGAQQHLPMILAGLRREGRRQGDQGRAAIDERCE